MPQARIVLGYAAGAWVTSCLWPHREESPRTAFGTNLAMLSSDQATLGNWALAKAKVHSTQAAPTTTKTLSTQSCCEESPARRAIRTLQHLVDSALFWSNILRRLANAFQNSCFQMEPQRWKVVYVIRTPEQRNTGQNQKIISLQEVIDMFQEEADEVGVGKVRKGLLERQGWGKIGTLYVEWDFWWSV